MGVRGNRVLASWRASLIDFGEAWYLPCKSLGVRIVFVVGFQIWSMVVMPCMYNLLRYFMEFCFCSCEKRELGRRKEGGLTLFGLLNNM